MLREFKVGLPVCNGGWPSKDGLWMKDQYQVEELARLMGQDKIQEDEHYINFFAER